MRCKIPARDLNARLNKTIIRYDDVPYMVITNENELHLFEITDVNFRKTVKIILADDERLDVSTPPLGYFNATIESQAYYAVRLPVRMYKQGLCLQSLNVHSVNGVKVRSAAILDKGYRDACMGIFPHVEKAVSMIRKKEFASVAINNDVALMDVGDGVINVYLRQTVVGYIPKNAKTVYVPSDDLGWVVSLYLNGYDWEVE